MTEDKRDQFERMRDDQAQRDSDSSARAREALHQLRPVALAVDTNWYVLDGGNREVDLQQSWQSRAIDLSARGLKTLLPEIWEQEITKFFERSVVTWLAHKQPQADLIGDALLVDSVRAVESRLRFLKNDVKNIANGLWETYKAKIGVEVLSTPTDCLERVLKRHLEGRPPFTKSKSDEFPDAFALEALESYSRMHGGILVAIASKDVACLDYCRSSSCLLPFWSVERALEALSSREEIERLLQVSQRLSEELSQDSSRLLESLRGALLSSRALSAYNGNMFHPNIPAPFQPYIFIESILSTRLVKSGPHDLLVRVQSEQSQHLSINGRVEIKAVANGRVSARDTTIDGYGPMELDLYPLREVVFEMDFTAISWRHEDVGKWSGWQVFINGPLFDLPMPPSHWEAKPHA